MEANIVDKARKSSAPPQTVIAHNRLWEVDALRGMAVVMMVTYHFLYDLYFFGMSNVIFTNPFWFYFQRTTATIFIALMGVSLTLRQGRSGGRTTYSAFAKRGLQLIGWGVIISVVTWFALGPTLYIRFGILHFMGLSILLSYPFLRWRWVNVGLGIVLIVLGIWLQQFRFDPPWGYLFWLGLEPPNHAYADFFPLVRWFGVVLVGIGIGNWLYARGERQFTLIDRSLVPPVAGLRILGHNTLPIYVLHQPLLLALFVIVRWFWG